MARSLRFALFLLIAAGVQAAEPEPKPPYEGEIASEGVRIRGGDGITYLVIGHSAAGQRVTVRESRFGWLGIDVPDSCTVWIHKSMVQVGADGKRAKVARDRVNVRARAEMKADILGQVPVGTELTVVDEDGDWIGIGPPPQARAWVHGKFIRKVGEATAAAKPKPGPKVVKDGIDGRAGAVLMNKANALYRKELGKPSGERQLDGVLAIYQQVASKCTDRGLAAQAEAARQRLLKILDLLAAVKKTDSKIQAFEEKYDKLEAEYKRRAQSPER